VAFEERCFQDAMDLPTALDLDYVRPAYWRLPEKPTRRIDEFTSLYGDPDGAYRVMRFDPDTELYQIIDQQPRRQTTVEDIERQVEAMERGLPDFQPTEAIAADWQRAMEVHGETRAVQSGGVGVGIPREPAWLEATALRPDLVGRYLTLLGGINSATLHRGIRDDVVRETMAALEVAHECGSLMVGCSNLIVCQTPMASFEAMMETLWANR